LRDIRSRILESGDIASFFRQRHLAGDRVAIDIPIGLADSAQRSCDMAARQLLGWPRSSSVFSAPCRLTLQATSYAEACVINRKVTGRGISKQTYGILPKIREIDAALASAMQGTVRESHPEVLFARLSCGGRGLAPSKKSPEGRIVRLELLHRYLPRFDPAMIRIGLGRASVALDDVIDAGACLIAAKHIAEGTAAVLPQGSLERDARGLRMEIVA
jgi:predicted RNase H-like nuclease